MTVLEQLLKLRDEMLGFRERIEITRDEDIRAWITNRVAMLDVIIDEVEKADGKPKTE